MNDHDLRAAGVMGEALERIERARGALYELHQLIGGSDNQLDEVVSELRKAGRDVLAEELERELIGMDVLEGRWTFQIVEEFDSGFYDTWKRWEQRVREETVDGERHALEKQMKRDRQPV